MSLRSALNGATERLVAAGIPSGRVDAELLLAHVLGIPRSRLLLALEPTAPEQASLDALVTRRVAREPLQHLLGTAVLGPVEVAVGPGVFVPRPETELLLEWGLDAVRRVPSPCVVDLCTGSGALALALAAARPDASVHAVERSPAALEWARRNALGTGVTVVEGDVTSLSVLSVLSDLDGAADLVVANPPYIPSGTAVGPEVAHDPADAVFAGPDGLAVLGPLLLTAARLCRPRGALAVEHDASHGDEVAALAREAGFVGVVVRDDLAGRPRFTTGTRRAAD